MHIDNIIDGIYDLFDKEMYKSDINGMAALEFGLELSRVLITQLDTNLIISILSITLPKKSFPPRERFAEEAVKVIAQREPDDAPEILSGLI